MGREENPQRSGKNIIRIFSASCVLYNKTERIQGIFICKIYRVASFEVLKMSSTAKTTLLSSPLLTKDKFKIKTFPYLLILCYLNKTQLNFCHLQPEWKQRLLHEKSLFLLRMIGKLSGQGKRSPFEIVLPAKLEIKSSD